jgi:general secretion pathway protein D
MILFRRIGVGLFLLTGLSIMCLAASNFAQAQPKKGADDGKKPAARKPVDWTEEKYTLDLDGKEWKYLFTWLATEADLPFVSKYKAPAGTINFIAPKSREFSLLQIYDLINERLQATEKYTLLRSDVSISLVPADEDIPSSLIPRITIEELKGRGRTEIVELLIPLKGSLVAEEFAPSFKRLLGDFGRVTPIPDTNSLIVRADVAALRRHLPSVMAAKDEKTGKVIDDQNAHTYSHKCEYIRASTAEAVLTKALGQSRQIIETKLATPKGQSGSDETPRPPGGGTSRKVREHTITVEKASNTVIISGPTDKIDQAKAILAKIDAPRNKGDKKLLPTYPGQLKYHDLPGGNADAVSKLLNDIYKADDSVRISVAGPARLMVWADPQTHFEINALTAESAPTVSLTTVSISLNRLDAAKIAESLKKMIPTSEKGSPFIEADPDQNSIRVRGTAEEIKDVRTIISVLDDSPISQTNGKARDSVIINLEKGSGATLAEAVYLIFGKLRPDITVTKVLPGQLDQRLKIDFKLPDNKPDVKPDAKPLEKKITRLTPEKLREAIYMNGKEVPVIFDSQTEKQQEKKEPDKKKSAIIITGFGNKIIITSDDPKALDLAQQVIRMLVNTEAGPGDFEVVQLKWADAINVANILDEAFNGPKNQRGGGGPRGGGGFPGFGFPGFGGGGGPGGAAQGARVENIRVVADTTTNSLLIRAKPVDMLTIRRLIDRQLDVNNVDSDKIARTFIIGPLKNATAANVSEVVERVYRDHLSRSAQTFSQTSPGFSLFQRQTTSDPVGGPNALLAISPDPTTNSIVVQCSTTLKDQIKKLVEDLDDAAGNSKQVIKIVSIKDIDPLLVQQAIDSISGRSTAMQQPRRPGDPGYGTTPGSFAPGAFGTPGRGGFTGGGGFPGGGFGGGGFPGGGFGGGGVPGGGFGGGGVPGGGIFITPGGGAGGGRPGGGGGGPKGGGPKGGASLYRGPDFFVSRVMDDPSANVLYDPSEEQDAPPIVPYRERYLKAPSYTANPIHFTSLEQELVPPPKELKGKDLKDDVFAPRLGVQVEVLPDLGILVLRANSPADLAAIMQIIELIRVYSQPALIEVKLVPVRLGDPIQIVNVLGQLYGRVVIGPYDTKIRPLAGTPGPAQPLAPPVAAPGAAPQPQVGAAAQPTNIVLIPQPRLSAILVAASRARMPDIVEQIHLLDQNPSDPHHAKFYPLKRAAAAQVAASLTTFYATRFPPPDNINQIRFTSDVGSNTVIVQASPADLKEIDRLIKHIDETASLYKNEIRVYQLRAAVASDLAQLLQLSIANGVLAVSQTAGGAPGPIPGAVLGQQGLTTKDATVRLIPSNSKDGKPFETRILEDIRVNADIRTNSLVISAPAESMPLVIALVRELDLPPTAKSEINIFQLKKSDATQLALMLQQLFTGTGVTGAKAPGGLPGVPTPPTAPGLPGAAGTRPPIQFTISGTSDFGAPIIDLRITVDERTNSLIVAGARNDLLVVETIIARIEDAKIQERRSEAVRLRNSQAVDVANAVTTFLTNYQALYVKYNQGTNFLELQREVIVVAEPISNSLLINATPQYFDMIMNLIAKLDTSVPQVVVQVVIAEVDMNGTEEFGTEIGLQNPLSFTRGLIQGGTPAGTTAVTYTAVAGGGPGSPGTTTSQQPFGNPGFFFANPNIPIPNNTGISPRQLGIESLTNLGVGRVSSVSGLGGYTFSANSGMVSVLIRALKIQGRLTVLSRPQLTTLDNQTAVIQNVTYFPIVTGGVTVTTGVVTAPPITHVPLGVTMQVTPRITPDGRVIMRVIPEVSAIDSTTFPLGNGTVGTSYKTQHLETTVSASDGETVLIGGLITKVDTKNENKIPWLGDLPGIGAAFRYRTYDNKKLELVIIMTPHIVRNAHERERILAEESHRIDWNLGDLMRIHGSGNGMPWLPEVMCETQSQTQPFRIYPGRPGYAEWAPRGAEPADTTPLAPQPTAQPAPQSNRAPIGRGGLLQAITGRRATESAPEPLMPAAPPPKTTVQYLPTTPGLPTTPPLRELIPPGNATPQASVPTGTGVTMPPNNTIYAPTNR